MKIRIYDKDYIETCKKILDLDKQEREHLKRLPQIREDVKNNMLEQDYTGKPLKLMTETDVEASMEAFAAEEKWMQEHKRLLKEMFSYPRDIVKELLYSD